MVWVLSFLRVGVTGGITDRDGWSRSRSRGGSGRVFCEDSAATCSMLTSGTGNKSKKQINTEIMTFSRLCKGNKGKGNKELEL